jgi:hypothetical protein
VGGMRLRLGLAPVLLAAAFAAPAVGAAGRGCAAAAPLLPAGGAVAGRLVPSGAGSLLLCRYRGLNAAAGARRLNGTRLITRRPEVASLTRQFDALPTSTLMFHCPMDDGSEIAATFLFAHRAAVLVTVELTGCTTVTNGHVTRTAATGAGPKLIARLEALVG